jgi:hypothetical protein
MTKLTSTEVDRIISDAIAVVNTNIPYNAQDDRDTEFANYFVAKRFVKLLKSRVDKFEKKQKDGIKTGTLTANSLSENYSVTSEIGTPRETFDKDAFIDAVAKEFKLMKHKVTEIASTCTKTSAAPISIDVEYIGDVKK